MIEKKDILNFLEENKETLTSTYSLMKIGLFGSFASGKESESSDIDLIVDFFPNTKDISDKKSELKRIIKQKFNREVDICTEKYIKPYFKSQILKSAIYV